MQVIISKKSLVSRARLEQRVPGAENVQPLRFCGAKTERLCTPCRPLACFRIAAHVIEKMCPCWSQAAIWLEVWDVFSFIHPSILTTGWIKCKKKSVHPEHNLGKLDQVELNDCMACVLNKMH